MKDRTFYHAVLLQKQVSNINITCMTELVVYMSLTKETK